MERTATCPQCGRPVRLTEEELIAKRGFCAVCDARFDLLPELFIGDGPMRSLMVPQTAALSAPPTSKMREFNRQYMIFPVGPSKGPMFAVAGFGAFVLGTLGLALGGPYAVSLLLGGGAFAVLSLLIFLSTSRDECSIEHDRLVVRRGVGRFKSTRSAKLSDIEAFNVSTIRHNNNVSSAVVKALIPGRDPLIIGEGLGHSEEAMTWLARRLEKAAREARK